MASPDGGGGHTGSLGIYVYGQNKDYNMLDVDPIHPILFGTFGFVFCKDSACWCTHDARCMCDDDLAAPSWCWDRVNRVQCSSYIYGRDRIVYINPFNVSATVVRGNTVLCKGQHFWGLNIHHIQGSELRVGVGMAEVTLSVSMMVSPFRCAVGDSNTSWGLSNAGILYHDGTVLSTNEPFCAGSVVGVHLDTWHGSLTFFNGTRLTATVKIPARKFYPMVSALATGSTVHIAKTASVPGVTLEYLCCRCIRNSRPHAIDLFEGLSVPVNLKKILERRYPWIAYSM